jgi:hypothetical protein
MGGRGVIYSRAVFRTWWASVTCLVLCYAVILSGIALRSQSSVRPRLDYWLLGGLTLLPLAMSARVLTLLRYLERTHPEPDAAMALLFDMSISLPIMCLAFVSTVLWLLD